MADATSAKVAALSGEDAAVYGYGVIGAYVTGDNLAGATSALTIHRQRAQVLRSQLGSDAVPPAPAYDLPTPVTDESSAAATASLIENRLAAIYAELAGATTGDERTNAIATASEYAVRAVSWGGVPQAFPS